MSINVSISVTGIAEAANWVEGRIEQLESELAYRIVDESRKLMDDSTPAGRLYRRGSFRRGHSRGLRGSRARGPGVRIHRASAPGQPPAEDTGRLYRDITVRRMAKGGYRVRFGAAYAGYLEFNLNRPFVLPGIEIAEQKTFGNL